MQKAAAQDLYRLDIIENCLKQFFSDASLLYKAEVDSTNSWGMQLPFADEKPSSTLSGKIRLLISDTQSAGRGRRGRSWSSPASGDIYMTWVADGHFPLQSASLLPLAMGLASLQALLPELPEGLALKWPNDLHYQGRKLAGILCEARLGVEAVQRFVLGLGLNVQRLQFSEELAETATSLALLKPELQWRRDELVCRILEAFAKLWPLCLRLDTRFVRIYEKHCINIGKTVQARSSDGRPLLARVTALSKTGELLLQGADGETFLVNSGEALIVNEHE